MENIRLEYKKAEIVEAAKTVFAEKGYSAATMKEISKVCNIGEVVFITILSTVEEIYYEVLRQQKLQPDIEPTNIYDFLRTLESELINIDKSLYRAVVEYYLMNSFTAFQNLN